MPTSLHPLRQERGIIVFSVDCESHCTPVISRRCNNKLVSMPYLSFCPIAIQARLVCNFVDSTSKDTLINYIVKHGTQRGGGFARQPVTCTHECIDLTDSTQEVTHHTRNVAEGLHQGNQNYTINGQLRFMTLPQHRDKWRPHRKLRYKRHHHPLLQNMTEEDYNYIKEHALVGNETLLINYPSQRGLFITGKQIRGLLSPGAMTNDNVITVFLERIWQIYQIKYVSTFFFTVFQRDKNWRSVTRWFASDTTNLHPASKPKITGETAIDIPIHVHGSHWVALVRREHQGRVIFLYADDLNCPKTEHSIQKLLRDHADERFYPPTSQWLHCKSSTYLPHSNECGPRTLMALTIMSTAYMIHDKILLPYMHHNLAQIARTWTAHILLSGIPISSDLSHTYPLSSFHPTLTSEPYDLIKWDPDYDNESTQTKHTACIYTDISYETKVPEHNILEKENGQKPSKKAIDSTSTATPFHDLVENLLHRLDATTAYSVTPTIHLTDQNTPQINKSVASSIKSLPEMSDKNDDMPGSETHPSAETPPKKDRYKQTIFPWAAPRQPVSEYTENSFVSTPPRIDTTKILRIVAQNPQYSLQLGQHNTEIHSTLQQLLTLQASVFAVSSPNINWRNSSNTAYFKNVIKGAFQYIHMSYDSSVVGDQAPYNKYRNLIGGALILSLDHWATRVVSSNGDNRGHGSFTMTTYSGRRNKSLTIICAYIAVQKGSDLGETSFYSQQTLLMEQQWKATTNTPYRHKCPRKEAIKELHWVIIELKEKNHSIILFLDANQTSQSCYTKGDIKMHTIEWLRLETGMDDPFIQSQGTQPTTTTLHPGRDIDYILTWQVSPQYVSLLPLNIPSYSDHHAFCLDIDIQSLFDNTYSELQQQPRRLLTSTNIKAQATYIHNVQQEWKTQKIHEHVLDLYNTVLDNKAPALLEQLQTLDDEITKILLNAESTCNTAHKTRNPWSPQLLLAGKIYSYWKRKMRMCNRNSFRWHLLDNYEDLNISEDLHSNTERSIIAENLRNA